MEEINILVICSNPNGVDFNFPQNKELIKKMCNKDIKYDFIDVKYNDKKYINPNKPTFKGLVT